MFCQNTNCGAEINGQYQYCPQCGGCNFGQAHPGARTLPPVARNPEQAALSFWRSQGKKTGILLLIGIAISLILFSSMQKLVIDADARFDGSWDQISVESHFQYKSLLGLRNESLVPSITVTTASGVVIGSSNGSTVKIDDSRSASREALQVEICGSTQGLFRTLEACETLPLEASPKRPHIDEADLSYPLADHQPERIAYTLKLSQTRLRFGKPNADENWEVLAPIESDAQLRMWIGSNTAEAAEIVIKPGQNPQEGNFSSSPNWPALASVFDAYRENGGDLEAHFEFRQQGTALKTYTANLHFLSKEERLFNEFPVLAAALQIRKNPGAYRIRIEEVFGNDAYADIRDITVDESLGQISMSFSYRGIAEARIGPVSKSSARAQGSYEATLPLLGRTTIGVELNFNRDGSARGRWRNQDFSGEFEIIKR